jgi:CHAT domain-containing protein/tetratricopeptide (TPR) repeat protein
MPRGQRFLSAVRLLAIAAGVAAIVVATLRFGRTTPAGSRTLEGRLGGNAWAPFAAKPLAGLPPTGDLRLASALAKTVESRGGSTPAGRHAAGVAHLLAGRTRNALFELRGAAEASNDPQIWSDLSTTYIAASTQFESLELMADALTAADAALARDPRLPEALFNRALAIEKLGLRDDARIAWQHYLAVDGGSDWAREARAHMAALEPIEPFADVLSRDYETLTSKSEAAFALARKYPEEARRWGEARILGRWAAAETRGDRNEAERHLGLARNFAKALAGVNDDRMLHRAVAAIDMADAQRRRILAAAHIALGKAHDAYNDAEQPIEAERLFAAAAEDFQAGGSPMALVARYYRGNMIYEQGRAAEALAMLEPLLAAASPDYPSLRACLLWEIGLCHGAAARWGPLIEAWKEAIAIFERLGEPSQATVLRGMLAASYERLGDADVAWQHRTIALRGLGRFTNFRLQQGLSSISRGAMMRRQWQMALSFLNLEIEIGRRIDDEVLFADALLLRATVRHRVGDQRGASADLAEARGVIASIKDAAFHARVHAKELAARATVEASSATAISLLNDAIDFHSRKGLRLLLPNLYLQRARALRDGGDLPGAAADLERGIVEVESHRESLPAGEARWGVFHAAEELFEEAIDVALRRDRVEEAFALNERARARSLLDAYGRVPAFDRSALPVDTTVVEYAALPSKLVIFTADAVEIVATVVPCDDAVLERDVQAMLSALRTNDRPSAKRLGAALYERILGPVQERIARAANLVFVPDRSLTSLPFGALVARDGTYLIERHTVVAGLSASIFTAAERRRAARTPSRVLIVTRSEAGTAGGSLRFVEREAERIASSYETATRLSGDEASLDVIAKAAPVSEAIHFGGHAVGDRAGFEPASILLSDGRGGERRAAVPEIAKLPLRNVSVVVLAGCGTAMGERRSLEGVISVTYGFLAAGAPSVIATLWPIDDQEAADLFPRIHAGLARGLSPAEALRAAQLDSLRNPRTSTSIWAAVQVFGS